MFVSIFLKTELPSDNEPYIYIYAYVCVRICLFMDYSAFFFGSLLVFECVFAHARYCNFQVRF